MKYLNLSSSLYDAIILTLWSTWILAPPEWCYNTNTMKYLNLSSSLYDAVVLSQELFPLMFPQLGRSNIQVNVFSASQKLFTSENNGIMKTKVGLVHCCWSSFIFVKINDHFTWMGTSWAIFLHIQQDLKDDLVKY